MIRIFNEPLEQQTFRCNLFFWWGSWWRKRSHPAMIITAAREPARRASRSNWIPLPANLQPSYSSLGWITKMNNFLFNFKDESLGWITKTSASLCFGSDLSKEKILSDQKSIRAADSSASLSGRSLNKLQKEVLEIEKPCETLKDLHGIWAIGNHTMESCQRWTQPHDFDFCSTTASSIRWPHNVSLVVESFWWSLWWSNGSSTKGES